MNFGALAVVSVCIMHLEIRVVKEVLNWRSFCNTVNQILMLTEALDPNQRLTSDAQLFCITA